MIEPKNQQGNATDWWFIYKTPDRTGRHNNQGFDFFYYDPVTKVLALSPIGLDQDDLALNHTLSKIFDSPDTTGYLVYNDEHVDQEKNSSEKGHCKGILAFDKTTDSGLFLLHSTPRFPGQGVANLPEDEAIYGQTFLCITLPDYATANRIAQQMLVQQNPQILKANSRIPSYLKDDEPLSQLYHGNGVLESEQALDTRCQPGKAKRRLVVPGSREAILETRRAVGA
ncbi:MAG: deoxyribonuclease II family protein, partial [Candidatus Thiodiazotropha sp.]